MDDAAKNLVISLDKILGLSDEWKEQITNWLQQHGAVAIEGYQLKIFRKTDNEWDIRLEWNDEDYGNKLHRQFTIGECRIDDTAAVLNLTSEYQLYDPPYFKTETYKNPRIRNLKELQDALKKHCNPTEIDL